MTHAHGHTRSRTDDERARTQSGDHQDLAAACLLMCVRSFIYRRTDAVLTSDHTFRVPHACMQEPASLAGL